MLWSNLYAGQQGVISMCFWYPFGCQTDGIGGSGASNAADFSNTEPTSQRAKLAAWATCPAPPGQSACEISWVLELLPLPLWCKCFGSHCSYLPSSHAELTADSRPQQNVQHAHAQHWGVFLLKCFRDVCSLKYTYFDTPVQPFATLPLFLQFHEMFLKVGVTKYQFSR